MSLGRARFDNTLNQDTFFLFLCPDWLCANWTECLDNIFSNKIEHKTEKELPSAPTVHGSHLNCNRKSTFMRDQLVPARETFCHVPSPGGQRI